MPAPDPSNRYPRPAIPFEMIEAIQHGYGHTNALRIGFSTVPYVGPNELLLRVRAAGVSRGVWHLMTGEPYLVRLASGLTRPRHSNPGMDVCGEVVDIGAGAERFELGQRVFGIARGSFAEYAVAKVGKVALAPQEWTDLEASVVAESGLTALQALDAGGIAAGDGRGKRVLVLGASGGVGSFAVSLASRYGADVSAVCSLEKAGHVRALGAARTFDYRTENALAPAGRTT